MRSQTKKENQREVKTIATLLAAALLCSFANAQTPAPINWKEVDSIYNLKSNKTDLQKEAAWARFKGQRVTWAGKVVDINEDWFGGVTLSVRMNKSTLTFDLSISLKESEKAKAMSLSKEQIVRFGGTLEEWGSLLPITLVDGEII